MEGVVGPQSRFLRRRVADLNLRRLYGAYILAIHRRGAGLSGNFDEVRLQMGDTLLLEGSAESMKLLFDYKEPVNLSHPAERPLRRDKAPIAVAAVRSEERRGGKACVSTCRSGWSPVHKK